MKSGQASFEGFLKFIICYGNIFYKWLIGFCPVLDPDINYKFISKDNRKASICLNSVTAKSLNAQLKWSIKSILIIKYNVATFLPIWPSYCFNNGSFGHFLPSVVSFQSPFVSFI